MSQQLKGVFITSSQSLTTQDYDAYYADTTSGAVTLTIVADATVNGQTITVGHVAGTNTLTVAPASGSIDGVSSIVIPLGATATLHRRPTDTASTPANYTWTSVCDKANDGVSVLVYKNGTQSIASGVEALVVYDTTDTSVNSTNVLASGSVSPNQAGYMHLLFSADMNLAVASTGTVLVNILRGATLAWFNTYIFEVSGTSTTARTVNAPYQVPVAAGTVWTIKVKNNTGQSLTLNFPSLLVRVEK